MWLYSCVQKQEIFISHHKLSREALSKCSKALEPKDYQASRGNLPALRPRTANSIDDWLSSPSDRSPESNHGGCQDVYPKLGRGGRTTRCSKRGGEDSDQPPLRRGDRITCVRHQGGDRHVCHEAVPRGAYRLVRVMGRAISR